MAKSYNKGVGAFWDVPEDPAWEQGLKDSPGNQDFSLISSKKPKLLILKNLKIERCKIFYCFIYKI